MVRNRIYRDTFDEDWVKQQLPTGELVRQLWRKLTTTLAPVAILASLLLTILTVFAFYQANQAGEARRIAEEAQNAARIEHLSASGLLAVYSPSPYAGDQRRASLLVRQAWNMTRTEQLPDSRVASLPRQAMSNLLRANQVMGHLSATWQGHSNWVSIVAFSPDGKRVVSGSGDNTLRLWDATTGQPLGEPWQGHNAPVLSVDFSPDGKRVVSGSDGSPNSRWDYMLLIWDVDEDSWKRRGCAIAGRNLSLTEWRRYLPGRDYEKTCPDYPVHPEVIIDALSQAA